MALCVTCGHGHANHGTGDVCLVVGCPCLAFDPAMKQEGRVGCTVDPRGVPLTLGDMRSLVARADELHLPNHVVPEFRTPLSGDRRAVAVTLAWFPPANVVDVDPAGDITT